MFRAKPIIILSILLLSGLGLRAQPYENMTSRGRDGRDLFFSDTLNVYGLYRPYPEATQDLTPAPKGYKAVYLSSYQRHGSRKLHKAEYSSLVRKTLAAADSAGALTPLGRSIFIKVSAIDDDGSQSIGELTTLGETQHRGIAARMCRNYPSIFKSKNASVRCRSTVVQRTMMSMFANNEELLRLNPRLEIRRSASKSFTYLNNSGLDAYSSDPHRPSDDFLAENLDFTPILGGLFKAGAPCLQDTTVFIRCLYLTAAIVPDLDIKDANFIHKVFSDEELYILDQALSYMMYVRTSSSPLNGGSPLAAQRMLLQDIIQRADAALASGKPSADLRFGHDSYLIPLVALMGVNGYDKAEPDPLKVSDIFQDYSVSPMGGNLQLVFFRDRKGSVLVKALLNEQEASLPIPTDHFPYYPWKETRDYLINKTQ